jgi:FMN phosphatase YigB (HAD superfamily)
MIDDRRRNLLAAQALGMRVILFNRRQVDYSGARVDNFAELSQMLCP